MFVSGTWTPLVLLLTSWWKGRRHFWATCISWDKEVVLDLITPNVRADPDGTMQTCSDRDLVGLGLVGCMWSVLILQTVNYDSYWRHVSCCNLRLATPEALQVWSSVSGAGSEEWVLSLLYSNLLKVRSRSVHQQPQTRSSAGATGPSWSLIVRLKLINVVAVQLLSDHAKHGIDTVGLRGTLQSDYNSQSSSLLLLLLLLMSSTELKWHLTLTSARRCLCPEPWAPPVPAQTILRPSRRPRVTAPQRSPPAPCRGWSSPPGTAVSRTRSAPPPTSRSARPPTPSSVRMSTNKNVKLRKGVRA